MSLDCVPDEELKPIFDSFDADGSGRIDIPELVNVLMKIRDQLNMDEEDCKAKAFKIIEKSNELGTADNKISFDEFRQVLKESL